MGFKAFGARADGRRLERMHASPRWRDGAFRNVHPVAPGLRDASAPMPTIRDFVRGGGRRVPAGPLPRVDPRAAWARPPASGLRATWLGHSTVLVEIGGARILTDPVFGPRASPSTLLGPKRFHPMPVALARMPPLDAVVVSHDHYDHLDLPTVRWLARHSDVPFVTSLGVGAHLQAWGVAPQRIRELDWWQAARLPGHDVEVVAAPSQHFSGRGLGDRNATLWSSMVIRSSRHAVFFSGDTGLTAEYAAIRERLGPFDLTMLEVGAFHPAWGDIHLGPDHALEAHALLGGSAGGAGLLLPVHWSTFALAMHPWDQPAERLVEAAPAAGARLALPRLGEAFEPAGDVPERPWWRGVDERARAEAARCRLLQREPPKPPTPRPAPGGVAPQAPWPLD